jgi:hypothetical protein
MPGTVGMGAAVQTRIEVRMVDGEVFAAESTMSAAFVGAEFRRVRTGGGWFAVGATSVNLAHAVSVTITAVPQ